MRRRTLILCFSGIAVLCAIAYRHSEPWREARRESRCIANLHEIYSALLLYRSDWPGPEDAPGFGNIPLAPFNDPRLLLKYLNSPDELYCPNTPASVRKGLITSYMFLPKLVTAKNRADLSAYMSGQELELARERADYTLVRCVVHDETYYYPREREESDDFVVGQFVIDLKLDGRVIEERVLTPRNPVVTSF